jgi:hypothetical protein
VLKGSSERERERVEGGRRSRYRIFSGCLCVCVCVVVSMCFWVEPDIMSWGAVRTRELWHSPIS